MNDPLTCDWRAEVLCVLVYEKRKAPLAALPEVPAWGNSSPVRQVATTHFMKQKHNNVNFNRHTLQLVVSLSWQYTKFVFIMAEIILRFLCFIQKHRR